MVRKKLRPLPGDEDVKKYMVEIITENSEMLSKVMKELFDTISQTRKEDQPKEFAYGKLLNYLAAQKGPEIINLCAAALWEIQKLTAEWEWNINLSE